MLFSTYVSLGIDMSGILRSVYLVRIFFSKIIGQPFKSKDSPRNTMQNPFFWGRVLMSFAPLALPLP